MTTVAQPNTNKLSLAHASEAGGQLEKSEQFYRRALAVRGSAADLETAALLNNLAALYQQRGEARRAERLYLRALRMKEKLTGP